MQCICYPNFLYIQYQIDMHGISRYVVIKKGTEETKKCFTMYIPTICMRTTYNWNIPCIYTMYIYHAYIMHIPLR